MCELPGAHHPVPSHRVLRTQRQLHPSVKNMGILRKKWLRVIKFKKKSHFRKWDFFLRSQCQWLEYWSTLDIASVQNSIVRLSVTGVLAEPSLAKLIFKILWVGVSLCSHMGNFHSHQWLSVAPFSHYRVSINLGLEWDSTFFMIMFRIMIKLQAGHACENFLKWWKCSKPEFPIWKLLTGWWVHEVGLIVISIDFSVYRPMSLMATEMDVGVLIKVIVTHVRNGKQGVRTHGVVTTNEITTPSN